MKQTVQDETHGAAAKWNPCKKPRFKPSLNPGSNPSLTKNLSTHVTLRSKTNSTQVETTFNPSSTQVGTKVRTQVHRLEPRFEARFNPGLPQVQRRFNPEFKLNPRLNSNKRKKLPIQVETRFETPQQNFFSSFLEQAFWVPASKSWLKKCCCLMGATKTKQAFSIQREHFQWLFRQVRMEMQRRYYETPMHLGEKIFLILSS